MVQDAGWSSLVARQAHNLKAAGSNPAPATNRICALRLSFREPLSLKLSNFGMPLERDHESTF